MNTMKDLRREVASRLRNALHGREIDMMQKQIEVPHMLGITPIGKIHDPNNEKMTLLDTSHPFWQDYEESLTTKNAVIEKIETAIRSLKKENTFRMTYPFGEEAEVVYIEVDRVGETKEKTISCANCDTDVQYSFTLRNRGNDYVISVTLNCPECSFNNQYERSMLRR